MTRRSLSDAEARWALEMVRSGKMTQKQVAAMLGATPSRVNQLVNGRTYKHLHGTAGTRTSDGGIRYGLDETPERRLWREAKFWARVDRSGGAKACWPWIGGKPNHYGQTATGQGMTGSSLAHVVAFTLARRLRKAPDWALVLRHLCDYKPCCNPAHLKPGTVGENLADRWEAYREGRTGVRDVTEPVAAPPGGWNIAAGDLNVLDHLARVSEFHARVDSSAGPDACWPWIAKSRHRFGYGFMRFEGQNTVPAHRIAYVVAHGLTLADIRHQMILHKCTEDAYRNNCNNPAHLMAGTQAENIADKKTHGTMPSGERHHMGRRYSDSLIAELRERYWRPRGKRPTITALAAEIGASIGVVSRWLKGASRPGAGGPTGPGQ
ncbi:HNH endonuclease [Streptomyces sp. NPDC086766]|uniref:HNH endonuclease n=1 Tax=Streptomyces sp. NPDC086766 TaxID=3365754 RepID=UPI00380CA529